MVRWNGKLGTAFPVLCGVRQGGILSPFLFAIYVDDLISSLRQCGYGVHIGNLFVGCVVYADDIVFRGFWRESVKSLQFFADLYRCRI